MRILIVEEALQTGNGHWPSYIGDLASGFRGVGDHVDVLVHADATEEVVSKVGGTRWFSRNCWLDSRSQGKIGGILHNRIFYRDLKNWLRSKPTYDWVLALTMRLQHLLAFGVLSRAGWVPDSTKLLLLFVQGFGTYQGTDEATTFNKNASSKIAQFAFRLLTPAVLKGKVTLAAETKGMQDELQRFTGLPVTLFPHPVPYPSDSVNRKSAIDSKENIAETSSVITITCPGFARHEKGNDLLQEAILKLLSKPENGSLRFVIQWPKPFEMPDGKKLEPHQDLIRDDRVEFIDRSLDGEEYESLLGRSDLIILPYRAESYHHRVSRVAIEAATNGISLIYMRGTWSGEVAKLVGDGVEIAKETSDAVAEAIVDAVNRFGTMKEIAKRNAHLVAEFHSVGHFRHLLEIEAK